jgi:predicted ATPase with chaperone activity
MPILAEEQWLFSPPVPRDMESLDLSPALVTDLVLRRLSVEGTATIQSLSSFLKLPVTIVHTVFTELRQQQLIEVKGTVGNDYRISLSGAGRALAAERLRACQYAGAAPVSLKAYSEAVKMQATEAEISRSTLRAAFSDLVIPDRLLDQLGPALIEQSSIFLYGPAGNGKSSLAERLLRVFQDSVFIPYAVEVDGQIISLYDPGHASARGGRHRRSGSPLGTLPPAVHHCGGRVDHGPARSPA